MRCSFVVSDFEKVIKDFAKKMDKKVNDVTRESAFSIFRNITAKTVVGNAGIWETKYPPAGYVGGHLKASLQINAETQDTNTVATSWSPQSNPHPSLPPLKKDPTIYINSNLPYSMRVLQENWSSQTPKNMADKAVKKEYLKLKRLSA